jgi:hypothetical protein
LIDVRSFLKLEKIDRSPEAVRKTGKAFLIAGCVFGAILFLGRSHVAGWTGWEWGRALESSTWKWFLGVGVALYAVSRLAPSVMTPIHIGWMTLAFLLGWFNTRLLLGIFFYLIITPVGLLMRALGKDLLNEKFDRSAGSYWVKKDRKPFDAQGYERLF